MNRSACVMLSLLIAFSLMNCGFTNWSNRVSDSTTQTSKLKWGITSDYVSQGDRGPDVTCERGLKNVRPISEGKDVGATNLNLKDTNKDGAIDTFNIEVSNAYPSYYNKIEIGGEEFRRNCREGRQSDHQLAGKNIYTKEWDRILPIRGWKNCE